MKDILALGEAFKKEHPQYQDLSDVEAGRMAKRAYPAAYADFVEYHIDEHVQALIDYYSPYRGKLTSWWQGRKAEARVKLQNILNEEQLLVLEQTAIFARAVMEGKKSQLDFEQLVARHSVTLYQLKAEAKLIENALAKGRTLETDQALIRNEGEAIIRTKEHEELSRINTHYDALREKINTDEAIRYERAMSEIRVSEAQRMKEIELNNEIRLIQEELRAGFIAQHLSGHQMRVMVQELRDAAYKQIAEIKSSNLDIETKRRMIADREEMIREWKNGNQKRLL